MKTTYLPSFNYGTIKFKRVGQLVFLDVCRPLPTEDLQENKYSVTLINEKSRLTMCQAICLKSDASTVLRNMIQIFKKLI